MSDASPDPRRPRAFRLNPAAPGEVAERSLASARAAPVTIVPQADPYAAQFAAGDADASATPDAIGTGHAFGLSWGSLFWAALGGLVSLALSLWVSRLIGELFAATAALGWLGVGLAALAGLALLALAGREVTAIFRQHHIARLHAGLAAAHAQDDRNSARTLLADLLNLSPRGRAWRGPPQRWRSICGP